MGEIQSERALAIARRAGVAVTTDAEYPRRPSQAARITRPGRRRAQPAGAAATAR